MRLQNAKDWNQQRTRSRGVEPGREPGTTERTLQELWWLLKRPID